GAPVPVICIRLVAFLAVQVRMDPRSRRTFVLLRGFMSLVPVAFGIPPESRQGGAQSVGRCVLPQGLAKLIERHPHCPGKHTPHFKTNVVVESHGTMAGMKIALGADHAGFELKDRIKEHLLEKGIIVDDRGTSSADSVDYPDYARAVAETVAAGNAEFGILV